MKKNKKIKKRLEDKRKRVRERERKREGRRKRVGEKERKVKNKNPCERRFFVLCARTFSAERCLFRPATRARINIKGKCVSSSSSSSTSNTTFSSSSSTLFSPLPLLPTSSPFRSHPLPPPLSLSLSSPSSLPFSFHLPSIPFQS